MKTFILAICVLMLFNQSKSQSSEFENGLIVNCGFKEWLNHFKYENKILKLDIPDQTGEKPLNEHYYLEWQANCLVLISTKSFMTYEIPLLVRKKKGNCGELKGEQLFYHLSCRFHDHLLRMLRYNVRDSYTLIDPELELYEVVHESDDSSKRVFKIGFVEGVFEMRTYKGQEGKIPEY